MVKLKRYIFGFLLALSFLNVGCVTEESSNVNQDRIYTSYELFYDTNEDKTYAKAQFKFGNAGGTLLKLSGNSGVKFNGETLVYDEGVATYQKQLAGKVMSGTFVWTDTNGKNFTNSITLNSIGFPPAVTEISRSGAFELSWVGTALEAKETVTATVFYSSNGGPPQVAVQSSQGSQSVTFGKNQLEALNAGNISISMDRSKSPDLAEKTAAGGIIVGKFRSQNANVTLKN